MLAAYFPKDSAITDHRWQIQRTLLFCNHRNRDQPPDRSSSEGRRLSPPLPGRLLVGMGPRRPPTGCNIQGVCPHRR